MSIRMDMQFLYEIEVDDGKGTKLYPCRDKNGNFSVNLDGRSEGKGRYKPTSFDELLQHFAVGHFKGKGSIRMKAQGVEGNGNGRSLANPRGSAKAFISENFWRLVEEKKESMGSHRIALVIPQQSNDSGSRKSPYATLLPSSTQETATAFTPEEMESTKSEAENVGALLEGFDGEDQDVLVKRRVNQGRFRKSLLRYWGGCCCVNEVRDERLLVASHIVPWSKASKQERGDPENGLLLSVVWDALFDRGIISFRDDGSAILDRLDRTLLDALGIDETKATIVCDKLTLKHKEYLRRHRMLFRFE